MEVRYERDWNNFNKHDDKQAISAIDTTQWADRLVDENIIAHN